MVSILKTLGIGILTTILSPLILVVLVLYFVYTLVGFIIMFIIEIFNFFSGKSILDEMPIDIEAKKILNAVADQEQKFRESIINNTPVTQSVTNNDENRGDEE